MEKRNLPIVLGSFIGFMAFVLVYNYIFHEDYPGVNFMFFFSGSGTPFDMIKTPLDSVKGGLIIYQIIVFILYASYMVLFYICYYPIKKAIVKAKEKHALKHKTDQIKGSYVHEK